MCDKAQGSEPVSRVTLLHDAPYAPADQGLATSHIVLLLDQFPKVMGGGERIVLRLARLLHGAGYRVSIVTFQVMCDASLLAEAPCPIYLLPLKNVFSAAALRGAWTFGQFLRKQHVRIVMTFFESSNLYGGLVTKALSHARLIWNRRDMGILRDGRHRLAYRFLGWLPDYVIAVSEEVRRHAIEQDEIPASRVGVVYNGLERLRDPGAREQLASPVIVTVGNLRPVKGQDTLLEATALVLRRHPGARVRIAGEALDRDFAADLHRRVVHLGIVDRVEFLGNVPDPWSVLCDASIFVLPSRSEGFSNAIVEAMMAGLPVVATRVGGNAEAIVEGETGFLVPPDQPDALAAALCTLLDDPARAKQMGCAGRQRVERHFTAVRMVQQLETIFAEVEQAKP